MLSIIASVAHLDRALGFEPRGREFESLRTHQSYQGFPVNRWEPFSFVRGARHGGHWGAKLISERREHVGNSANLAELLRVRAGRQYCYLGPKQQLLICRSQVRALVGDPKSRPDNRQVIAEGFDGGEHGPPGASVPQAVRVFLREERGRRNANPQAATWLMHHNAHQHRALHPEPLQASLLG